MGADTKKGSLYSLQKLKGYFGNLFYSVSGVFKASFKPMYPKIAEATDPIIIATLEVVIIAGSV